MINLCRYSGLNAHPALRLGGNYLVVPVGEKRQLIRGFDALRRYHGGGISCPADTGQQVLAILFYPTHAVRISVGLTGCQTVTNGDITRLAANLGGKNPAGPRLLSQLKKLAAHRVTYH
jgi:hypothetical protein